LAISKKYLLIPAWRRVDMNSGSWVLGEQAAATSRLRRCSLMISRIDSCESCEQV
jgi:hypothetical protein